MTSIHNIQTTKLTTNESQHLRGLKMIVARFIKYTFVCRSEPAEKQLKHLGVILKIVNCIIPFATTVYTEEIATGIARSVKNAINGETGIAKNVKNVSRQCGLDLFDFIFFV